MRFYYDPQRRRRSFCKRHFTEVYPKIKQNYIDTNKVKLVFRDFIAVPSHNPAATLEAVAANCARNRVEMQHIINFMIRSILKQLLMVTVFEKTNPYYC
mgnify:CR=1 FL=1